MKRKNGKEEEKQSRGVSISILRTIRRRRLQERKERRRRTGRKSREEEEECGGVSISILSGRLARLLGRFGSVPRRL